MPVFANLVGKPDGGQVRGIQLIRSGQERTTAEVGGPMADRYPYL